VEIDLSEYIGEYCAELFEQLEELQSRLLELEQDSTNKEIVNEIFRIAHTIKGSAATMGFEHIASVAHAFEDLLGEVRDGNCAITDPVFKSFLDAYDAIRVLADCVRDAEDPPDSLDTGAVERRLRSFLETETPPPPRTAEPEQVDVLGRLGEFGHGGSRLSPEDELRAELGIPSDGGLTAVAPSAAGGVTTYHITMTFDPDIDMKSVRAFLVLNHLRDVGDIIETRPSEKDIEEDRFDDSLDIVIATTMPITEIESILAFGEARSIRLNPVAPGARVGGAAASRPATPRTTPPVKPAQPAPTPQRQAQPIKPVAAAVPPRPATAPEPSRPQPARPPASVEAAGGSDEEEFLKKLLGSVDDGMHKPAPAPAPVEEKFFEEEPAPDGRLVDQLNEEQRNTVIESINQDLNVFEIRIQFVDSKAQSMLRSMTVMNYLGEMSRIVLSHPTRSALENGDFFGVLQLIIATEKEINQLRELLLAEEVARTSFWPISLDGLDIVTLETEPPTLDRTVETASASLPPMRARTAEERKAGIPTVRVTVDRLDSLMNLVGELVIKKTQLNQVYSEFENAGDIESLRLGIQELNQGLDRITSDLQAGIMKVRMVQIGQVFYRFSRLVRDLSKNLGKKVEFLIEGAETELDKTVIDEIGDPLMHLIRNCLDHGVEAPEVRKRLGKSEKGILLLRAQHAGNHIIVETADDGAGIDTDRVKRKALEKGLIDAATAAKLTPAEINAFIFMPGFSTSGSVTNVSGRGVGMDVVKETIERLQGDIQIKSEKNVGTTIQIKLPLTLAIIQGLLVRVCNEKFTIPLSTVAETVILRENQIHTINNQRVVTIRDEVVPLIYLHEFFRLERRSDDNKFFIVLAGDVDNKVGLVVNHLYGRREIVIKSLDRRFTSVKGFAGGTVLGDGTVSLILDIPSLVEESRRAYLGVGA